MVKVVRTPAEAKKTFTANQLCGWNTDGIAVGTSMFTPRKKKRRKIQDRVHFVEDRDPPPVQTIEGGKLLKAPKLKF